MLFEKIIETKKIGEYLKNHLLLKQYKKAKNNILFGIDSKNFFKERKPKGSGIFYFRINKKYMALGYIEDNKLIVYKIDNHQ